MKDKLTSLKTSAEFALMTGLAFAANPFQMISASADTSIGGPENAPTIGADGTVTIKGGDKDIKTGATSLMTNAQLWVGIVAGISALALIGFGVWYGWKAGKKIQEGNSSGWGSAGYVVGGTIIGGLLMGAVGLFLAVGAASGKSFFG